MAAFQIPCCMQLPITILQICMSLCPDSALSLGTCSPKLSSMTLNDPPNDCRNHGMQIFWPWMDCHHPCAHFDMAQAYASTKEALAVGTWKLLGPFFSICRAKPTLAWFSCVPMRCKFQSRWLTCKYYATCNCQCPFYKDACLCT